MRDPKQRPKFKVFTLACALVMFLLPWTLVTCDGSPALTQTGVQAITGEFELHGQGQSVVEAVMEVDVSTTTSRELQEDLDTEGLERAMWIMGAFVVVVGGLVSALLYAWRGWRLGVDAGWWALVALALLGVQWGVGFPVDAWMGVMVREMDLGDSSIVLTRSRTSWSVLVLLLLAMSASVTLWRAWRDRGVTPSGVTPNQEADVEMTAS